MTLNVGQRLANGWTLVAVRLDNGGPNKYIVLACDSPRDHTDRQYATWRCTNREDTWGGMYFKDFEMAYLDFKTREMRFSYDRLVEEAEALRKYVSEVADRKE